MTSAVDHWYLARLKSRGEAAAFIWEGGALAYDQLYAATRSWLQRLDEEGMGLLKSTGLMKMNKEKMVTLQQSHNINNMSQVKR